MQKLDFTEKIKALRDLLKSDQIVNFIDGLPISSAIDTLPLTPMIIESKSSYDKIAKDDSMMEILKAINGPSLYSQKTIGDLINETLKVSHNGHTKFQLFLVPNIIDFLRFHKSIIDASQLAERVLFSEKLDEINQEDTILFRILIVEELEITKYIRILTLLTDLIDVIQKIDSSDKGCHTITLLDSGSDTNIGIKTGVDTAKSLFQIFKEVWDWMLNRKFYKNKLRNAGLLENLDVIIAIQNAYKQGVIDEDTAKIYRETIIRRTEDLLELNVLPKLLSEQNTAIESVRILNEFNETKMLEAGKND